jgi:hypothetical protein
MNHTEQKNKIDRVFDSVADSIMTRVQTVSNESELNTFTNETIREFQEILPYSVGYYISDKISKTERIDLHNYSVEKSYSIHNLYSKLWKEKFNEIKL